MSNSFIPRAYQAPEPEVPAAPPKAAPSPAARPADKTGMLLMKIGQYLFVALSFLLPIAFTPGVLATLGFNKVMLALTVGLGIVVLVSLAALRFKSVKTVLPLPLVLFWIAVVAAFASAFLSGDVMDALRGSFLGPQTAGFLALLALTMTTALILQGSKLLNLYTLIAFGAGAGLLFLYNLIRFIAGPVLGFGSFPQVTSSPIGGLNDLAVYAGVTIIVSLITLLQLPLKKWMSGALSLLILVSLAMLMVANFFNLWIILGFFALLFLIYILSRDTLFGSPEDADTPASMFVVLPTLVVCLVSILFVVAGDAAGARVNAVTGVDYIEVRPSFGATVDVMRSVYQEDILLGTGPNRFGDAWRLHKDRSINETTFWNVDFNSGFGLIPTLFITLGLLGGILIFAFHAAFVYLGYKALLRNDNQDPFWYYLGTVSFVSASILWGISYVYVPGAAVLLMTAILTGLAFVSYGALVSRSTKVLQLATNRRRGLFFMGITVVLVVLSVSTLFSAGQQYSAQAAFSEGAATATSVEEFEVSVQSAYALYSDERFLNALNRLKIVQLQELLGIPEPSEADQARFASLAQQTLALAGESVQRDNTSPAGYTALAEVYNLLAQAGVEGASDQTLTSIAEAETRDPFNPTYDLTRASIAARGGDYEQARSLISEAVSLKNNFTPAYFLLAQIAIEEGNVEQAIAATEQVIRFEPNNPVRYYQLGMLLAANDQIDEAILAYRAALQRDGSYANARYMLGLALASQGEADAALAEFRQILQTNQDNQALIALIEELEATGSLSALELGLEAPVEEVADAETTEDGVVSSNAPDTDLLTPVNTQASPEEAVIEEAVPTEPVEEQSVETTEAPADAS